jgi:hypothetical protein
MFRKKKSPRDEVEQTTGYAKVVVNPLFGKNLPASAAGPISPRDTRGQSISRADVPPFHEKNPAPYVDPE